MQIDIKQPHDSIFKNVFDDIKNTKDFLRAYLPNDLVKQIDFETMKEAPTEKRDLQAKKNHFDLSVDCNIGEKKSRIYILFEHKSYQDKQTLMQILRYCLVLWENEIRNNKDSLTPIVPFIFYHGELKSGLHENIRDYFEVEDEFKKYLLDFPITIFDTTKIEDSEIKQKINHNLFLMTSVLLMKNIFGDNLKPIVKAIIELDDERKVMLFEYIAINKDMTEEKFNEMIIELKGDTKMANLAEIWMARGEIKGLQENIKTGLEMKFNQISDKLFSTIQNIKETDKLKEILKALFVINDADEFKQFIQKNL